MRDASDVPPDEGLVDDEPTMGEFIEAAAEFHDIERCDRLWLRSCHAFIETSQRPNATEHSSVRVQLAMNDVLIAACERAARIFRSDLPPVGWDLENNQDCPVRESDEQPELGG